MTADATPGERARPASAGMRRGHAHALRQLELMAELARGTDAELGTRAEAISGWSVAEQLEHLMLVDGGVLHLMERILDDPGLEPAEGTNLVGRLVLRAGFLPRGRARAKAAHRPSAAPAAAVRAGLPEVDRRLRALGPRLGELERATGRARHPYFGGLGDRQWVRFLAVHHHHHLKIVRDIRLARGLAAIRLPAR
jgi:DinB superfamily